MPLVCGTGLLVSALGVRRTEQVLSCASTQTLKGELAATWVEPELLYDRGELHNLSISRGTLNPEERYKINEHIIQTIRMLAALPFPAHLQAVPEIAGGHHETTDGRGYPRGLTAEQMSPLARMMALNICVSMAAERHLEPSCWSCS